MLQCLHNKCRSHDKQKAINSIHVKKMNRFGIPVMARECLVRVHKMSSLLDENDILKYDGRPCITVTNYHQTLWHCYWLRLIQILIL